MRILSNRTLDLMLSEAQSRGIALGAEGVRRQYEAILNIDYSKVLAVKQAEEILKQKGGEL